MSCMQKMRSYLRWSAIRAAAGRDIMHRKHTHCKEPRAPIGGWTINKSHISHTLFLVYPFLVIFPYLTSPISLLNGELNDRCGTDSEFRLVRPVQAIVAAKRCNIHRVGLVWRAGYLKQRTMPDADVISYRESVGWAFDPNGHQ
ncbi:unnamed protein product [Kuraishia capsulata CBS 1993]|uniref:Uncharacterized protein n=1 Tax=Kuraishia capsulata CBS 1993 TaxID=1382522 RepID=W6MQF2_9ASCO|nr:uncharacterized protein KUCA_T00004970001 [Kuraishia capsulata CBS 1993]CDK28984.1 unnamed protein product [Kuraishia capsulata CBS 1993]